MQQVKETPKVLVLTMFCGEPQYERCIQSVNSQVGVQCTHYLIENKPNVEAHKELYETINANRKYYDYFVKLDADMEFSSCESLVTIISFFKQETDHLTIPVFDFFINDDMPALSVFSNRVFFDTSEMDRLYVDNLKIDYLGNRHNELQSLRLVYHCYKPSKEQSIAFGIHRALKICQRDRSIPNLSACKYHYSTLRKVVKELEVLGSEDNRYYSVMAAAMVFNKEITGTMENKKEFLSKGFMLSKSKRSIEYWFKGYEILSIVKILGIHRFLLGVSKSLSIRSKRILLKLLH